MTKEQVEKGKNILDRILVLNNHMPKKLITSDYRITKNQALGRKKKLFFSITAAAKENYFAYSACSKKGVIIPQERMNDPDAYACMKTKAVTFVFKNGEVNECPCVPVFLIGEEIRND